MAFYHYTLEKYLPAVQKDGLYSNCAFTKTEYYDVYSAGNALGVMPHNIDCVLMFADDGYFKQLNNVAASNRFAGGGTEYTHPFRPKPIAIRKIDGRSWRNL
jgi:hypothetical protein